MSCGSILNNTKKSLGIDPDYKVFDPDIIMYINTTLANLNQLGVGPVEGFSINNESTIWEEYFGDDKNLNLVPTYVTLKVRLLFDPPTTSFAIEAIQKQITEMEWRLSVMGSTNPGGKEYIHGYD